MTLDEIILSKPDEVEYIIELEGNTNPSLRYILNSFDESKATVQQVETFLTKEILRTTSGYVVYTPPLDDPLEPYKELVSGAIEYFTEVQIEFAAENITMGITASGKTKAVADYLQNVLRYGQSGSLYEVISEIDALKSASVPVELSPWVTEERLDDFKNKIIGYLT